MAKALKQSYDWCYRVARGSGSSFYRAFWLLERPQRMAMFALYAFARITDDLGDEPHPAENIAQADKPDQVDELAGSSAGPSHVSQARLATWSRLLSDHLAESVLRAPATLTADVGRQLAAEKNLEQYNQLWPALRDTVARYGIPPSLLQELVVGVSMDTGAVRFEQWSDVDRYAYHVASTVGLACTRIWQAADTLPRGPAIDCGLAFQLTNILRDLREDAARNRVYLPLSELARFGCDESSWLAGKPQGDWTGLVDSVILRTRGLYESGKHTIDHLPKSGKRMFGLMWSTYHQLLDAIAQQKDLLWSGQRVRVSGFKRTQLLINALLTTPNSERLGRG